MSGSDKEGYMNMIVHYSGSNDCNVCSGDTSETKMLINHLSAVTCPKCFEAIHQDYQFSYDSLGKERHENVLFKPTGKKIGSARFINTENGFNSFLCDLWVDPEHRSKGIASRIVREIMWQNKPPIQLSAKIYEPGDNGLNQDKLIGFYKNLGFNIMVPNNDSMIWYPKIEGNIEIVVTVKGLMTIARIKEYPSMQEFGETIEGAIGKLVQTYPVLFDCKFDFE